MPIDDNAQKLPAEKLLDLPPHTRDFLEELRAEEIERLRLVRLMPPHVVAYLTSLREEEVIYLRDAIQFARSMGVAGRAVKWAAILFFGCFMAVLTVTNLLRQLFPSWWGRLP